MGCPHSPSDASRGEEERGSRGLDRRDFVKVALAIGGTSALSACLDRRGAPDVSRGDPASVPRRQFAWNGYIPRDSHGNTVLPNHQLILFFRYLGDGPTAEEREQIESALRSVERAYQWGNGGRNPFSTEGVDIDGVLFTLGWSPGYFERTSGGRPDLDFPRPEETLREIDEDPGLADPHDAAMVLMSDSVPVLLSIEQALRGRVDELDGVPVEADFGGVLEVTERRTGFIGRGVPHRELTDEVPERSPQAMGWKSGFIGNQASEDAVTLQDGPFEGGSIQHISELELHLDRWYERDRETQVHLMFSPDHTVEQTGDIGEFLAGDSGVTRETVGDLEEHAENRGVVGHTQKVAGARDDDFEPRILRRAEGVSTSHDGALNFTSLQLGINAFVEARKAMNAPDLDVEDDRNGIVDFMETHARGNYLVPPRELRALPPARS